MENNKEVIEKSILFTPLFLAFLWMGYLVLGVTTPQSGAQLSPSRLDGLVNALFIFIILYAIVLSVVFYHMNKKLKKEEKLLKSTPKTKKKSSKKKKK